jgi:hypothetical protein
MEALARGADLDNLLNDSTVIRAHQHAAGPQKKGWSKDRALGRSRGGFGTKVHIAVDALGNPVRLIITDGQVAEVTRGGKPSSPRSRSSM